MRQGNGAELLGPNDPRGKDIGIIEVASTDERKDVLTALLTQVKLERNQIVVMLPQQNRAFQRAQDFDALKDTIKNKKIRTEIIFVAPNESEAAKNARQRRFTYYSSLESYANVLRGQAPSGKDEKKGGARFGSKRSVGPAATGAASGAAAGMAAQPPQTPQLPQPPARTPLRSLYADQPTIDINDPGKPAPPPDQAAHEDGSSAAAGFVAGTAGGLLAADALAAHHQQAGSVSDHGDSGIDDLLDDDDALPPTNPSEGTRPNNKPMLEDLPTTPAQPEGPAPVKRRRSSLPLDAAATGAAAGAQSAADDLDEPKIITFKDKQPRRRTVKLPNEPADAAAPPVVPPSTPRRTTGNTGNGTRSGKVGNTTKTGKTNKTGAVAAGAAAGLAAGALMSGATSSGNTGAQPRVGGPPKIANRAGTPARGGAGTGRVTFGSGGAAGMRTGGKGSGGGKRRFPLWLVAVLVLLLVLTACIGSLAVNAAPTRFISSMFAGAPSSTTISITPKSSTIQKNYVITVVDKPDPDQRQVSLHTIESKPEPKKGTVTATGQGKTELIQATGTITFYNGDFESVTLGIETFPVGNGISIVTDGAVTIPAAVPGGDQGIASVKAHANKGGTAGNIGALTINQQCCVKAIFAKNLSAFTGGQDAQDFTFLQEKDVEGFTTKAKDAIKKEAQDGISPQLKAGEQLAQVNCDDPKVEMDHAVGDHVANANITVSATCMGQAFDRAGTDKIVSQLLTEEAKRQLGEKSDNYTLAGKIISQIGLLSSEQDKLTLQATTRGVWYYKFSEQQQTALKDKIKGKSRSEAQAILAREAGIKQIKIEGADPLPTDPTQIKFNFVSISGAKSSDLPKPEATVISPLITPTVSATDLPAK